MRKAKEGGFDQAPNEPAETERADNRSEPIEAVSFVAGTFRHAPVGNGNHGKRERKIDEKDCTPGDVFDQPTAEHGSYRRGDSAKARPRADGASAIFFAKGTADKSETAGHEQRRAQSLRHAHRDELPDSWREPAPRRGHGEKDDANDEYSPPAVAIA